MEYQQKTHQNSPDTNIDATLAKIQMKIATELMKIHNEHCERQFTSPLDVYAISLYGRNKDGNVSAVMKPFVEAEFDFVMIGHGLDSDVDFPKDDILKEYIKLDERIRVLKQSAND